MKPSSVLASLLAAPLLVLFVALAAPLPAQADDLPATKQTPAEKEAAAAKRKEQKERRAKRKAEAAAKKEQVAAAKKP